MHKRFENIKPFLFWNIFLLQSKKKGVKYISNQI
jgi:hypothetical protein